MTLSKTRILVIHYICDKPDKTYAEMEEKSQVKNCILLHSPVPCINDSIFGKFLSLKINLFY